MATADHRPVQVDPVGEQLSHGAAIAVGIDPADPNLPALNHDPQVVTSQSGWARVGLAAFQLWGVDAGQPDLLAFRAGAGIAVVAASDLHGGHC